MINTIIIILFVLLLLLYFHHLYIRGQEENTETFENKMDNPEMEREKYDKEFVDFYEITYRDTTDSQKDMEYIIQKSIPSKIQNDVNILIAGCGVGKLASLFKRKYRNVVGVDNSKIMIEKSYELHPNIRFVYGDLTNKNLFEKDTFTHIIFDHNCLNYNDPKVMNQILKNCNSWLKTNGYLVVPIFDKKSIGISPRYYTTSYVDNKGVLHGYTYLNGFAHDGYMIQDDVSGKDNVLLFDKIILEDGNHRIKKTSLFIPEKEDIYEMILKNNFQLESIAKEIKRKQDFYELALFKKGQKIMNVNDLEKKLNKN